MSWMLLLVACSQPAANVDAGTTNDAGAVDAATSDAFVVDAGSTSDASVTDAAATSDAGADGGATPSTIYASTNTALYTFDPAASSLTMVGAYDCIGGTGQDTAMTDIAVDASGALYGISHSAVHTITVSAGTVHCAQSTAITGTTVTFYGLAVAPAGALGTSETLLATALDGSIWAIDASSGQLTQHGTLGTVPANDGRGHVYANAGMPWEMAGDIVFVRSSSGATRAFANVRDCPAPPSTAGCDAIDTLVELDVAALAIAGTGNDVHAVQGQIVRSAACSDTALGYGSIYGLASSASSLIGFTHTGIVVTVDFTTGGGCGSSPGSAPQYNGAGVTNAVATSAP
jgi:hypothetical protein